MTRFAQIAGLAVLLTGLWIKSLAADEINVVASIKPIHALVSGVMAGVGTPYLIVKGAASPHGYALKPSDARALENASVVFWVGEDLERFLERSIHSLARKAQIFWMIDAPGITRLEVREGGLFGGHNHDGESKGHKGHQGHDHGTVDMHLWLDPENAKAMVRFIAQSLSQTDPKNASTYAANAKKLTGELDQLSSALAGILAPYKGAQFFVFHDSYQYFERRYELLAAGSIAVNPDTPPGAHRVQEIRKKIAATGVRCVFAEPQFNPRLIAVVTEGMSVHTGTLDPIGSALEDGPELYFKLLRNIASEMKNCLGG